MRLSKNTIFILPFLFLLSTLFTFAQNDIPTGTWRTHLSYRNVKQVLNTKDKVYAISENGIFEFDTVEKSIRTLDKKDGISETNVSYLAYQKENDRVLIAYRSGGVDLIENGEIYQINSFKLATINGNKEIHHVSFDKNLAYASTNLGLVVIDCEKKLIREIYDYLGANASLLKVQSSQTLNDSIYIATEKGLFSALNSSKVNLKDYNSWKKQASNLANDTIKNLLIFKNKLVLENDSKLYTYEKGIFTDLNLSVSKNIKVRSFKDKLYWAKKDSTFSFDGTKKEHKVIPYTKEITDISIDENNVLWLADLENGLVSTIEGSYKSYYPSGPWSSLTYKLYGLNQKVYGLGKDSKKSEASAFYIFNKNSQWENYNASTNEALKATGIIANYSNIIENINDNKIYISSFTSGLIAFDKENNSFQNLNDEAPSYLKDLNNKFRISDTEIDYQGNLWTLLNNSNTLLAKRNPDGEWTSVLDARTSSIKNPKSIHIAPNNEKWIIPESGLLVYNETKNDYYYSSSNLPHHFINDLAFDLEGELWIVSNEGFGSINGYFDEFKSSGFSFNKPIHEGYKVFPEEKMNCITIDGGNRKWIGSDKGIYLMDKNGEETLARFTKDNSILPSDTIIDLEFQPKSGELFIATTAGMVSYKSDASQAASSQSKELKIFPNPVPPSFQGLVTISELVENANVKIIDNTGVKVFETQSNGGTATWDLRNQAGNKVRTGVYQVLVSSEDGKEIGSGHLAIIY